MTTKQDRRIAKLMDDVDDFTGRRITRANAEAILHRLDEIMREPGPDEVRVRACVATAQHGYWFVWGQNDVPDELVRNGATFDYDDPRVTWIEANVPAWQPPAEVTVEGEVDDA